MARETKVGLLAGLAFITCFAIILANRGQTRPVQYVVNTPQSNLPAGTALKSAPASDAKSVGPAIGLRTAPSRIDRIPQQNSNTSRFNGSPTGDEMNIPAGSDRRSAPPTHRPSAPGIDPNGQDAMAAAPGPESGALLNGAAPLVGGMDSDSAAREELLRRIRSSINDRGQIEPVQNDGGRGTEIPARLLEPTVNQSHNGPKQQTAHVGRKYVVAPGDSLSSIANKHYGSKSKSKIQAIVEANRAVITNPNQLKAGVELILPELDLPASPKKARNAAVDEAPNPKEKPTGATRTAKRADEPEKPSKELVANGERTDPGGKGFRWYQIKRDEGYMSIARAQLGDANRWKELADLNRDKFPDPKKIREGVRIKLPLTGTTALAEGRR